GAEGVQSEGSLVVEGTRLYGTTPLGGSGGHGTIFSIDTSGTGFLVLHNFTSLDRSGPHVGLTVSDAVLYGTTAWDGVPGKIFRIGTDGSGFATIHNFSTPVAGTNADGAIPYSTLIVSGNTLFGTAQAGGSGGLGTVFRVGTDGAAFTNLFNFAFSDQ